MDKSKRLGHIELAARSRYTSLHGGVCSLHKVFCLLALVHAPVMALPGSIGGSDIGIEINTASHVLRRDRGDDVAGVSNVGDASAMIHRWGRELDIDERVLAEMHRYADEEGEFGEGYARALTASVRRLILEGAASQLVALSKGQCNPFVEVTYEEPGFAAEDGQPPDRKPEQKFEAGFIRTELLACLKAEDIVPEDALRTYTDPEFRMKVSSRIKRIWLEGNESCIETKGLRPFLSSTLVCNRINEYRSSGLASQHSQVVSNPGGDDHQDVYFKESLKTFVRIPGGMALHYINYTRTVRLRGLKKRIGRKKVIESQQDAVRELQLILSPDGATN
jgi:hypothetical protein